MEATQGENKMAKAKEIQSNIDSSLYEDGWLGIDSYKYEDLVVACMEAVENKNQRAWVKWDYERSFDTKQLKQALRREKWSVFDVKYAAKVVDTARRQGYIGHSKEWGYSYAQVKDFFNGLSKNYNF
jgi:hypothetical protein